MSEGEAIIQVRGLTKRYGGSRGVEDLTFEVGAGEAFERMTGEAYLRAFAQLRGAVALAQIRGLAEPLDLDLSSGLRTAWFSFERRDLRA